LESWRNWNDKLIRHGAKQAEPVTTMVVVTTFAVQLIMAAHYKRHNRLWWKYGFYEQLFDLLVKDDSKGISQLLDDTFSDRAPIAHPEDPSNKDPSIQLYDEFGFPEYPRNCPESVVAEDLVCSIILSHFAKSFKLYLERITEMMNIYPQMDETYGFLTQTVLINLELYIFDLNFKVSNAWERLEMTLERMPAYIMESDVKDLWNLLSNTGDVTVTGMGIINSKKDEISSNGKFNPEDCKVYNDVVLKSHQNISNFVINPLDASNLAYF
jgi:hypothetical protein